MVSLLMWVRSVVKGSSQVFTWVVRINFSGAGKTHIGSPLLKYASMWPGLRRGQIRNSRLVFEALNWTRDWSVVSAGRGSVLSYTGWT